MYSFGFNQAFRRGFQQGDELYFTKVDTLRPFLMPESDSLHFLQCMESATNVLKCVIDTLAPSGYFRYAPDGQFFALVRNLNGLLI